MKVVDPTEAIRGIAAFDLDGTLLRGPTVSELLAEPLGRLQEMRRFEGFTQESDIVAAREEMARWYAEKPVPGFLVAVRSFVSTYQENFMAAETPQSLWAG